MNNEIKNELNLLLQYVKSKDEDKEFYLKWLLERFEEDIKRQLEDIEDKQNQLKHNLEMVDYVKKEYEKFLKESGSK